MASLPLKFYSSCFTFNSVSFFEVSVMIFFWGFKSWGREGNVHFMNIQLLQPPFFIRLPFTHWIVSAPLSKYMHNQICLDYVNCVKIGTQLYCSLQDHISHLEPPGGKIGFYKFVISNRSLNISTYSQWNLCYTQRL